MSHTVGNSGFCMRSELAVLPLQAGHSLLSQLRLCCAMPCAPCPTHRWQMPTALPWPAPQEPGVCTVPERWSAERRSCNRIKQAGPVCLCTAAQHGLRPSSSTAKTRQGAHAGRPHNAAQRPAQNVGHPARGGHHSRHLLRAQRVHLRGVQPLSPAWPPGQGCHAPQQDLHPDAAHSLLCRGATPLSGALAMPLVLPVSTCGAGLAR